MTASSTAHRRPDNGRLELVITFFYYRDLPAAIRFYEDVMGFTLAIDQGWSKIYHMMGGAHVGLVDESRGMHGAHDIKPVQLCIRVPNVDAWHVYLNQLGLDGISGVSSNERLGIRAFVFNDPEGYQIEVQSALK